MPSSKHAPGVRLARTPEPPYVAVIFTSVRRGADPAGYARAAAAMEQLAATQPGFLGLESARDTSGLGITVSYWTDEEAVRGWKRTAEHLEAQRRGRDHWYRDYALRVARVERAYTLATSPRMGLDEG